MSELKKIFNLYDRIEGNRKLVSEIMVRPNDISSSYPNLKFAKRTKNDEINKALLDDLQKASELTGLDITIDFAKTDHDKYSKSGNVSRHWSNQAVDIDYIGGKVVSPSNREIVNRYVDALISMGYVKNSESGNSKAVLTFGFPGHDNHIHVSNKLGSPSTVDPNYEPSDMDSSYGAGSEIDSKSTVSTGTGTDATKKTSDNKDTFLYDLAGTLGGLIGLKENFGRDIQKGLGTISIPGSSNKEIKSPIDGVINNSRFVSGCNNQIIIESETKPKFYLQYCGITRPKVRNGEKVSVGETIGIMDSKDVAEVILLDSSYTRKNLEPTSFKSSKQKNIDKSDDPKAPKEVSYYDPALAALVGLPGKIFGNVYDKETGELKTKKWAKIGDKRPVDPWIIDLVKKPFKKKEQQEEDEKKIKENINRIKGLL